MFEQSVLAQIAHDQVGHMRLEQIVQPPSLRPRSLLDGRPAPIYFSLLIEGAPFVGDHVNDDNLLQKGRPLK